MAKAEKARAKRLIVREGVAGNGRLGSLTGVQSLRAAMRSLEQIPQMDRRIRDLREHTRVLEDAVETMDKRLGERIADASRVGRSRLDVGRLDYAGAEIYLKLGSRLEVRRLGSCSKEPWTVRWIEEWLRPGETLYDVGANVGAYSLVAAKQHDGDVRVVAFEPSFATFASLCENLVLNDVSDSVLPLPVALSRNSGQAAFAYGDVTAGSAKHGLDCDDGSWGTSGSVYRQPVLTEPLDGLRERHALPPPNHVKLDVDGPELAVLEGAKATLEGPDLRSLMIELGAGQADPIEGFLAERGWVVHERFERTWRRPKPATPKYALFVRGSGQASDG